MEISYHILGLVDVITISISETGWAVWDGGHLESYSGLVPICTISVVISADSGQLKLSILED